MANAAAYLQLSQTVHALSEGRCRLLAISKTKPASDIRTLAELGQVDFGENYVQEAIAKQRELSDLRLCWHLVGPLQSNKAKTVAEHFDWVHSVDRVRIIEALARHRPADRPPLNVLLQVNIDDEQSKSGCAPEALPELAEAVVRQSSLRLRGLMCIPRAEAAMPELRLSFARMRSLLQALSPRYPECHQLSMGMSQDFPVAIEEGATWVRIGTRLFGARG